MRACIYVSVCVCVVCMYDVYMLYVPTCVFYKFMRARVIKG